MKLLPSIVVAILVLLGVFCRPSAALTANSFPKGASPISSLLSKAAPFSKDDTVIKAAQKVMKNTGYFDPIDETLFADDFIFRGPVIGPLNKEDYKQVLDYFGIYKAFPDIDPNCFGWSVDPENPYRVWFFVRATGTYQNPLGGPLGSVLEPDNQQYRGSPEAWSLTFDEYLKARLITAGYVADRFDENATTDGAGLSFGILKTLGLSLPSGVGDVRLQFTQTIAGPLSGVGISPKAVSAAKDVPSWWTNPKRGADA